jgi:hypothetical protein
MMIGFDCIQLHDDDSYESWSGQVEIHNAIHPYEVEVRARDSSFFIILGESTHGHYVCIPDWNVGCPLSTFRDIYWNTERLSRILSPVDASSVASAISAVADILLEF